MTPAPQPGNTPFNPVVARPLFGFSMSMNNRDYPYGMPTSMFVGIHTNMLTYSDNANKTKMVPSLTLKSHIVLNKRIKI